MEDFGKKAIQVDKYYFLVSHKSKKCVQINNAIGASTNINLKNKMLEI
jgi:hypothetical protein